MKSLIATMTRDLYFSDLSLSESPSTSKLFRSFLF